MIMMFVFLQKSNNSFSCSFLQLDHFSKETCAQVETIRSQEVSAMRQRLGLDG